MGDCAGPGVDRRAADADRRHTKIGLLHLWGNELLGGVVEELRAHAGKIGADTLVLRTGPRYPGCDQDEFETALALRWQ